MYKQINLQLIHFAYSILLEQVKRNEFAEVRKSISNSYAKFLPSLKHDFV